MKWKMVIASQDDPTNTWEEDYDIRTIKTQEQAQIYSEDLISLYNREEMYRRDMRENYVPQLRKLIKVII